MNEVQDTSYLKFINITKLNTMTKLKAINPKNQALVNKAINWLVKHNNYNTQRDLISGNLECEEYESKEWRAIDKKCVHSFDMYLEYLYDLPKGQQKAIENSNFY